MLALIELLRAVKEDTRKVDLTAFTSTDIEWVLYAGLGPTLCRAVSDTEIFPERALDRAAVTSADLTARMLIGNTLDAACEILVAAPALAQATTLLKGTAMSLRYPQPHLRTMGDIDLLAPSGAQREVESLLRDLGYIQRSEYPLEFYKNLHHSMPFFHAQRRVWVEVHTNLFPPASVLGHEKVFSDAHVREQTVVLNFHGNVTQQLSDELQIVYICSHWAKNFNQQRGLMALLDVIHLLRNRRAHLDWDRILRWLDASSAAAHLYLMLTYLGHYGLADIPREVGQRLAKIQSSLNSLNIALLHRLLDNYLLAGRRFGRIDSANTIATIWKSLLAPGMAVYNLASIPWKLAFPPSRQDRFNPRFQLSRLTSVLGLRR